MSYAILRTKKLKSASEIARVGRHNEREQRTLNADTERTKLNVNYRPELTGTLVERVRRRIGDRQHRKDAVLAVEVLMAYSPEAENSIDALSWGVASMDWLESEFGRENICSARLHHDEKTVHIQGVVVGIDPNDRLNCKHFLGGPRKLAALQTRYAAAVSKFGLKRGEEGSKRKHVPIRDLYRGANLLKDEADKVASIFDLLRNPVPVKVPAKGALESHRAYEERVNQLLRQLLLRVWEQLQAALETLLEAGRNIGLLNAERSARVAATRRARLAEKKTAIAERRAAKAEHMLETERNKNADLAKKISLPYRALSLSKVARDLLNVAPTHPDGTLVFTTDRHRLLVRDNSFHLIDMCGAADGLMKGTSPIDLVMAVMRCKYSRAVEYLASKYDTDAVRTTCTVRADAKTETLCRSPLPFSARETREALQRPETILGPASPPSKSK